MAYIGRGTDKISNIEKLDTITFDGSSSYTLQKNSVNFTPNSANSLQVSIDGVVQAGNFTVSGSTIDFGVAIPATSTNDFIFHYGTGLITTPADGTVTTAKLADSSVSLAKLTATGTKDATTFLRGDNSFATIASGLSEVDIWRVTADISLSSTDTDISSNWERADTFGSTVLGTGMTESSGIFTFPSTGYYLITAHTSGHNPSSASQYVSVDIHATTDNSTYSTASVGRSSVGQSTYHFGTYCQFIFKVTSTTNCKIKLRGNAQHSSTSVFGNTNLFSNSLMFIKLGDI